jgi:shikimate kinase
MPIEKNIILTGFMGTGKTTVGIEVARILQAPFCDLDSIIEEVASRKIYDIIQTEGEKYFRELESAAIESLSENAGLVIATGGGAVMSEMNFARLNILGTLFCLDTKLEILSLRLLHDNHRPLLPRNNRREHIANLLKQRNSAYQKILHHIDTSDMTSHQAASLIVEKYHEIIQKNGGGV